MGYTQPAMAAAVLALLAALTWALRRAGWISAGAGRRSGRRMEALERVALGPHHALHLVRVDREALVVASSPSGCVLLERVPAPPATDCREATP